MMQRLVPLALMAIFGMILSGCADLPPDLEDSLRDAGISFDGAEGGAPGFGSGGADPDGMASGSASSGGGDGGDSGPPTDGWPPNAGPGPDATPSDTYSDPDGTTYAEYEFDSSSEFEDFASDVSHKLKENGFEPDLEGIEGDALPTEYTYRNSETGETVVVDPAITGERIGTTYIP